MRDTLGEQGFTALVDVVRNPEVRLHKPLFADREISPGRFLNMAVEVLGSPRDAFAGGSRRVGGEPRH